MIYQTIKLQYNHVNHILFLLLKIYIKYIIYLLNIKHIIFTIYSKNLIYYNLEEIVIYIYSDLVFNKNLVTISK